VSADFAVRCTSCGYHWNSAAMADGLRVLGCCPKCKGELEFRDPAAGPTAPDVPAEPSAAPHMVLGIPRL
jgi:hypothetical protein